MTETTNKSTQLTTAELMRFHILAAELAEHTTVPIVQTQTPDWLSQLTQLVIANQSSQSDVNQPDVSWSDSTSAPVAR